jgi:hypothetical protein
MIPRRLLAIGLLLTAAGSALAHHSFAMFDALKSVTLQAVVKEVHWRNPHIWIDVVTVPEKGQPAEAWGIEAGATRTMIRQGWKRDSLKPGDNVSIELHPMRDGSKIGSLVKVTLPDGSVLRLGAQGANPDAKY